MSKQVTFRAYWQVYSDVTIDLPDDIDPNDEDEVKAFVQEQWDQMELPEDADYLPASDEVDFDHGVIISTKPKRK